MSGLFGGGGNTNTQQQAPLSQFNVQSSGYGLPVPLLYGRNRIAANLIWYGDFVATPHTQSYSAGKGGGGSSSSTNYTYSASIMFGLCEGAATAINQVWIDKDAAISPSAFSLFLGGSTQSAWSYLTSYHPTQALNYRGHCYAAAANYQLNSNAGIGNHSFDVTGLLPYSSTIKDAEPSAVITDYLTDPVHGVGFSTGLIGNWAQFQSYCVANNLFISPVYTSQNAANSTLNDLFTILNSGIFFSEAKLKIVPYSDTTASANSITYTPNTTPAFAFTDDDYLNHEEPVKINRVATSDAYNQVSVEYLDASNSFNTAIVTVQDQASIELYGLVAKDTVKAHMLTNATAARMVAQLILQKLLYTRNTYEFTVGWEYCQLEPCDYVTLTDARLGLNSAPVRILSVDEDTNGQLQITAEDAPSGISHAATYNTQPGSGYIVDFNVSPGSVVAPAFFEVPATQALSGLAIGIAVSGNNNPNWGGCDVYVSNDGTSYAYMGTVNQPARYGTITNTITNAVSQVAAVNLVGNGGQILTGSTADANNDSTSIIIGNEYADFTTAALVSTNNYNLTLAVRGAHGTAPAAHSSGEKFIRVDSAIAYSESLDLSTIGKTLHFKFLSFNIYGGAKQTLSGVTDYTYTITGSMAKLAPANVSSQSASFTAGGVILQWTSPTTDINLKSIEIWRGTVNITPGTTGADAVKIIGLDRDQQNYVDYVGLSATYFYFIRTINSQGFPSAFSSSLSATSGTVGGVPIVTDASTLTSSTNGDVVFSQASNSIWSWQPTTTHYINNADLANSYYNLVSATRAAFGSLSSISANLGTITAGNITLGTGGYLRQGQTAYNTGTGFWLGDVGGTTKFSVGTPSLGFTWDGSTFNVNGQLIATGNVLNNAITQSSISTAANSGPSTNGVWETTHTFVVATTASVTQVTFSAAATASGYQDVDSKYYGSTSVRILRNGSVIASFDNVAKGTGSSDLQTSSIGFTYLETGGAGTYTYQIQVRADGVNPVSSIANQTIVALQLKR